MEKDERLKTDPLENWKRTHDCGSLSISDIGKDVLLMGWVNSRRDLGNLIFIDLRDREGMTQIVFDPGIDETSHSRAHALRNEWVLAVKGTVSGRLHGQENKALPTGAIEIKVTELKILNQSDTPPFQVDGAVDASESLRLKYRYLELRRPQMINAFRKRHRIAAAVRDHLNENGFLEIETPFLTKSTPEGARDYLVPSRITKGAFYALPQSPQLFKQLLMISGFDRYYQIVRCFRDEDLRADRQPEFTQVDLEMAFIDENQVMALIEGLMKTIFQKVLNTDINVPIPRIEYAEAMDRYGTDRPDLRFEMTLKDISDPAEKSDFGIFKQALQAGGGVKAINVSGGAASFSRKGLDELSKLAIENGAKGLAWIKVTENGWQSSLNKFFSDPLRQAVIQTVESQPGDLIIIIADKRKTVNEALGALRLALAKQLNLISGDESYCFAWVTKFPLFEWDESEDRLQAVHHPFTAPLQDDIPLLKKHPEKVRARAYDLVLNGSEIGGGSIRIHDLSMQQDIFNTLGISTDDADRKFGFFLEALKYGAPPHGGIALGFDRLVAIMAGTQSIREVIAFPKTTRAACPLTEAPSLLDSAQLDELSLSLNPDADI